MRRVCKKCDMLGEVDKDFYKGRQICITCMKTYYNNRYNQVVKPKRIATKIQKKIDTPIEAVENK